MSVELDLPDEARSAALGAALAAALPRPAAGWLVTLQGELGAGKTTLVRGLLRALGHVAAVPSPTYTLVEPYSLAGGDVYHVDLYRIADAGELEFIGWDDVRSGLVLVEWPERAADLAAAADLVVQLEYADPGRRARISAGSARAGAAVEALATFSAESK